MKFAFWKNWLVISDTKLQTKKFWKKKNELISFNALLYQMLLFSLRISLYSPGQNAAVLY
jgi:hypothetical protein